MRSSINHLGTNTHGRYGDHLLSTDVQPVQERIVGYAD